jgi:predicted Rossmann fold nucleotide-binding protein DprA/Smf involved in DNA uptake
MDLNNYILSEDVQAIMLLTANIGKKEIDEPLTLKEYNTVAKWLSENNLRPMNIFGDSVLRELHDSKTVTIDVDRIRQLLDRGGKLALVLEKWFNQGLWIVSRIDEQYPKRIKKHLGNFSPPVLYGVGNRELLDSGGLAVVGSRKPDEKALQYTKRISEMCAGEDIQIISGGAKGIDREAMITVDDKGGAYIGVLANGLAKEALSGVYRNSLRDERGVLISPFNPEAGFNVGNAMSRNKYIYTLADWALVVSSSDKKGGTWAGAIENINKKWTPLFVRSEDNTPEGNRLLIEKGAHRLTLSGIESYGSLMKTLEVRSADRKTKNDNQSEESKKDNIQLTLFEESVD